MNDEILGFEGPQSKPTSLIGKQSNYLCDQVVIAAGPWSGALAKRLGVKLPIEAERGYHLMLGGAKGFKHAVNFHERYVGLTPMTNGLRITGMAEFAGLHAKPKMRRLDAVLKNIRQAVPGIGGSELLRWSGDRPSLPDSLPAIGRTVRAANVLFACGHDHLGMTMAPITGKLVAQLAAGERPDLNLTPYSPDRFK
ncbi:hypothetical protein GCM10007913_40430 [Devosia yakushimensis]|uniref:FAD dependent oxidoreductase domain-containing protein n=1 Tax=Devosia yakushimensis TaxID=470028 RepID=A0ABQ5UKW6_9HYPH|nr:hypothetical protein GCM10007913_40430 [Devosia yakushimensis]